VVSKLNDAMTKALRIPEVKLRFSLLNIELAPCSPEEFRRFLIHDSAHWTEIAHATVASVD